MKAPAGRLSRGARASNFDLLFQGILTCAHCGKRMEGNLAGNDVRYRCRDRSVRRT
ncbi:zinc ribbon domain-containing protein [Yimella lutea]|uniref:zinc ribbon domain-containing protein n=1 Tax=Yimella lutea TaxID=587872 RepID=UPI003CCC6E15